MTLIVACFILISSTIFLGSLPNLRPNRCRFTVGWLLFCGRWWLLRGVKPRDNPWLGRHQLKGMLQKNHIIAGRALKCPNVAKNTHQRTWRLNHYGVAFKAMRTVCGCHASTPFNKTCSQSPERSKGGVLPVLDLLARPASRARRNAIHKAPVLMSKPSDAMQRDASNPIAQKNSTIVKPPESTFALTASCIRTLQQSRS